MTSAAARLTIDLDALAANYAYLCEVAGKSLVAPVIKADGYGLGAALIGRRLWKEGARQFFVARMSEGHALRRGLGPDRPAIIYILDGFLAGTGPEILGSRLTPVLNSVAQIRHAVAWAGDLAEPPSVALQVDTGMNRQGMRPEELAALAAAPQALASLNPTLIMSHLGSATDPIDGRSTDQLDRFRPLRRMFPLIPASLAASAGIFLGSDYHFDMVRPGISLFGGGPEERPDPRLKSVATFEAPICDVLEVAAGQTIGYGGQTVVQKPTRLAVVAAGYADGLLRQARNGGMAWFKGALRPILSVTMDLTSVDIGTADAQPGEWIELMGPNAHIDLLAKAANSVAHECLVRLGSRAERIILGEI